MQLYEDLDEAHEKIKEIESKETIIQENSWMDRESRTQETIEDIIKDSRILEDDLQYLLVRMEEMRADSIKESVKTVLASMGNITKKLDSSRIEFKDKRSPTARNAAVVDTRG